MHFRHATLVCLLLAVGVPAGATNQARPGGRLHVASPDWRDQVLYMVMTDRFDDGDPRNNDQGAGEYRPGDPVGYQGGDLRGLRRRLDYIKGLGITGLWITPPVAQQWWSPVAGSAGYHGYWARHFAKLDHHLGSLADYRALSRGLHARRMVLVQDIVLNHMGNFFGYPQGWHPSDPARGWQALDTPPTQAPLHLNDPRRAADRAAALWHFTPDVANYQDPQQELRWQMSGLDDLATENPRVRRLLRRSYGHWIRAAGVDAFRLDTAFYVEPELLGDFLDARDSTAPGVRRVAGATGRRDFLVVGEGFGIDQPGSDTHARRIESLMRPPANMPGMLNFPLYGALGDALARGAPSAVLGERIGRMVALHPRLHRMPSFLDNHDVDRFLAGGSTAALRQGLLALMTLPGIPVLYYGTEQGFTEQRASMFAAGWGSGGRDRFDTQAPLYQAFAALAALRREHRLFSRGLPRIVRQQSSGPGVLAWRTEWGRERALVVLNTADSPQLLDALDAGLPPGGQLKGVHGLHGRPTDLVIGALGRLPSLVLPPRAGMVWRLAGQQAASASPLAHISAELSGTHPLQLVGRTDLAVPQLKLVVNGMLDEAVDVRVAPSGQFSFELPVQRWPDGEHRLVLWDPASGQTAPALTTRLQRPWQLLAEQADPAGDDTGPSGRYQYPTEAGWAQARPGDLRHVRLYRQGSTVKLELDMAGLMQTWNPANGFDHVAFTIYLQLPGVAGGAQSLPLQQASMPQGMRWHRRLRVHGWSNALFDAEGASDLHEGRPLAAAAQVQVDASQRRVSFTLPVAALQGASALQGLAVYVTTWDYDAGYRALAPQAQPYAFGGAEPGSPKVLDDALLVVP